jgi:acyl carrier protein
MNAVLTVARVDARADGRLRAHNQYIRFSMAGPQSPRERELAELIVSALNLEGVAASDIDPEQPLFKTGLGLDSIDALELALEISKRYGFQLRSDDPNNVRIFSSLRSLANHIDVNLRQSA